MNQYIPVSAQKQVTIDRSRLAQDRSKHTTKKKSKVINNFPKRSTSKPTYIANTPKIKTFTVKGVSFQMIKVEGGTFDMGATAEMQRNASSNEYPVHSVSLDTYYIGKTEVTQELWHAVMGKRDFTFKGDKNLPAESITWQDCQTFIERLNNLTRKRFRMPTEEEWEFAARGGNKSKGFCYSGGDEIQDVAWYQFNSSTTTHGVAQKKPNELGIYDMCGNVGEWCADIYKDYGATSYSSNEYIIRGSSCMDGIKICRSSYRDKVAATEKFSDIGLRLALSE